MRLAKPIYEGLPLAYGLLGAALLGISYHLRAGALCGLLALAGLLAIIAGAVIWLRRRDYRASSAEYLLRSTAKPPAEQEPHE